MEEVERGRLDYKDKINNKGGKAKLSKKPGLRHSLYFTSSDQAKNNSR